MASLDSGGHILLIHGSGDDYLDLANTHVQSKLTTADGSDLDVNDPVGPVNNWLHSLFNLVDVYLNGSLVTPSTNTYPYRAYFETLLSYGHAAVESAVAQGHGHLHGRRRDRRRRHALREFIVRSRDVDMMGRLHVDLFLQDKFLINNVDIKIRTKNAFGPAGSGSISSWWQRMPPWRTPRPLRIARSVDCKV